MEFLTREHGDQKNGVRGILFFRQLFSCSPVMINFFIAGLYMGAPTVMMPQLRKEANSTDIVTPEMESWLTSTSSYCSVPWIIIIPMLAHRFGRRFCLILISINVLIGNILFYFSSSYIELIISQAIQGMLLGSAFPITVMVMSEYTSPKYRGIILTSKAATVYWGVWVSNAIGTFYHWKNIGILIFICGIYSLISSILCYESPYWMASKRRFDECTRVHRWLKGCDEASELELKKIIDLQQNNFNNETQPNGLIKGNRISNLFNVMRRKSFYKPLVFACLPTFLYYFSGKIACTVYAIDIMKRITSNEQRAYKDMLILDGVTVAGMYVGSALSKIMTRRKQLLAFSFSGIAFLYFFSIYLYLVKFDIILENNYISLFILIGFTISIGCGPVILAPCCSAELTPLKHRSYFLTCFTLLSNLFLATTIKVSPFVFQICGTPGAFLFYAVSSTIFLFVLYKYLPETKDLTIQEIQINITRCDIHDRKTVETEIIPLKYPSSC